MTKLTQHSFLGGQLDWEMMGRQDVEKYQKGATLLKNVVLHKRGAAFKRPGTNYLWSVTDRIASDKYRLVPFASTQTQGWALLFTSNGIYAVSTLGVYAVTVPQTGFTAYSGDEVNELDYCQCGDIVYIAHRNHPPAMITHTVSGSTHSFALSIIDLNQQNDGIPSISGATVSKTGITTQGPSYTEHYKVTAVYDGVETFPSADYSNSNCADYDASYKKIQEDNAFKQAVGWPWVTTYIASQKTYAGTAYTLPWTESQKITLKIGVPSRTVNNETVYPDQIRIYRKTGSFYGLVGILDTSDMNDPDSMTYSPLPSATYYPDGATSAGNALVQNLSGIPSFGYGYNGFSANATTITIPETTKATVNITLGHVQYVETATSGESAARYDASPDFSTSATYAVDARCYYNSKYWKCTVAVETAGSWTGTANWQEVVPTTSAIFNKGQACSCYGSIWSCLADGTTGAWDSTAWEKSAISSITYTFRPCGASKVKVQLGNGSAKTASVKSYSTDLTKTVTKNSGESDVTFRNRAEAEMNEWLDKKKDTVSVAATVSASTASSSIVVTPLNSSNAAVTAVISNISVASVSSDPTTLTWEDKYYTPDVSVTPPSDANVMEAAGKYPGCVCLSQQRLIWASTTNDPSRVFMSEIGAFYTYSPHDVQVADDAIDFQVSETQFPRVCHMAELRKLILFTGASEWIVDSASANSGITFETIRATKHSCIGSSPTLKPLVCNNVLLFAERTGQAVRQYGYELEDDGFGGNDISIFAQSIFNEKKIVAWAYQQHPHSTCWCVLSDGTLASLTFNREQQCIAWATHAFGGGGLAKDIVCTQALVGNDATLKDTSEILVLVQRGSDYFVEQFRPEPKDTKDTPEHFVCMDSVKSCTSGTGRTGATLVDTATMRTVSTGSSGCVEGYPFDTRITTVYPVVANEIGMAQMDMKTVQGVGLRLMRSVGGKVKNALDADSAAVSLTKTALPTVSGGEATLAAVDERVLLASSNSRDGRVTVFQDGPFTFGVILVETDLDVEEHR